MSAMRSRIRLVALLPLLAAGCSAAEPPPPKLRAAPRPPDLASFVAASASATPGVEARPPLDLAAFSPLVTDPSLSKVARALEAGDAVQAARAAEAAFGASATGSRERALFLARLREQAGDLPGALGAYEAAEKPAWPLTPYAVLGEARVALALGRPDAALERLRGAPIDGPLARLSDQVRAEALLVSGSRDEAVAVLRRLAQPPGGGVAVGIALRLGDVLLSGNPPGSSTDAVEALALARRVLSEGPTERPTVDRAEDLERRALAAIPEQDRRALSRPTAELALARLRALSEVRKHEDALVAAEELVQSLDESLRYSAIGCEADLQRARSLAGLRKWGRAAELLGADAEKCKEPDLRARALFLAGKYSESDKRYAAAVKFYERLEKEIPTHRLADDARLRAALSYAELGADARFTDLLTRMPDDYPEGDMVLDGLFELAARRFGKGDWTSASLVLERAASLPLASTVDRGQELSGRERYFRARAWAIAGEAEKSRAEYEALIGFAPLSYYMLQAYSRLASEAPERAEQALAAALGRAGKEPFRLAHRPEFDSPGFIRALELLRVGDVEDAALELDALGVSRSGTDAEVLWGIALLYSRSGSAKLSQRVVQGMARDWLARWPAGDFRRAWQIAFPRPFHDLVEGAARRSAVPEPLVYAVMREESSFDPEAESPARAYGLMQLIEPTARQFGRALGLRPNAAELKRPAVNVPIGCRVLSELGRTFADNPLLAIPGYNAGPGASRRWLESRPDADFDVWVELIPYGETRRYTKRVLASRATYAFLYDEEHAAQAMRLPLRVSSRDTPVH